MPSVVSVNIGRPEPNPYKPAESTGIGKVPQAHPVEVRAPGPKHGGLGSGLVGDYIGDVRHHGGDDQAVYAFQLEDLARWAVRVGRDLSPGSFGENLTTAGIDLNAVRLGERWRVGSDVELQVACPRIPCATFRGWMHEPGWLRTFTLDARPGAYLRVVQPGRIASGDEIEVLDIPGHDVTIELSFLALTTEPDLLPRLQAVGSDLPSELMPG